MLTIPRRSCSFPRWMCAPTCPRSRKTAGASSARAPIEVMCASSRMVVKRKGAAAPVVLPCTLLPYDPAFEMGGDAGGSRARRWRHVRGGRGQALPRPLRQVLRARRRLLFGVTDEKSASNDSSLPTLVAHRWTIVTYRATTIWSGSGSYRRLSTGRGHGMDARIKLPSGMTRGSGHDGSGDRARVG